MLRILGFCWLCLLLWGQPLWWAQSELLAAPEPGLPTVELVRPHQTTVSSSAPPPPAVPMYPYSGELWEKFEQFRRDPQLQRLVEEDLQKSLVIRQVIQDEVDRTFNHTTALLNVLLVVLTALPVLAAAGLWFLRNSVINQVLSEVQSQIKQDMQQQFAQAAMTEIKAAKSQFEQEMKTLRDDFESRLERLNSDAQQAKDALIDQLRQLLPASIPDDISPDLQLELQALTQKIQALQASHKRLSFTAADYLEHGKALYLEGDYANAIAQYEQALAMTQNVPEAWYLKGIAEFKGQRLNDAIASYDRATCLKPEFYQAWFSKARSYALKGDQDLALEALAMAIKLNPERCRERAKTDATFDLLRQTQEGKRLLVPES